MPRTAKFSVLLLLVALALALASCGSSTSTTTTTTTAPAPAPSPALAGLCPAGHSHMGCALDGAKLAPKLSAKLPSGPRFPDVSSYQGHPNWAEAKPFISMAVAKAGEYQEDPDFVWNVEQFKQLGIKWSAYWFVRNTGCTHESAQIVSVLRSVGGPTSLPPVLDMEVPEARDYATCLADAIHTAFNRWPIIYTAPGTWPGGANDNLPLWIADYGPSFPCIWTCHPVAWQFASPPFVDVSIPGIGVADVSVDFGFSKLTPVPPRPADPHHYSRFVNGKFHTNRWGVLSERSVVEHYDGARQHTAKYKTYLRKLRAELRYLADRDYAIAHKDKVNGKPSWGKYHRGYRFQELIHRSQGQTVSS